MMQQSIPLTVFTPTYNRAYCLGRLYESLLRQSSKDFIWLVIDDGSSDGTSELVKGWQEDGRIAIDYHYKQNGGMHSGHNKAYELITTEFNTCIDSDDYMPDDAVAIILEEIDGLPPEFAGIVGLDATEDGAVIGTQIPASLDRCTLSGLYQQHGVSGDKKLVYRTEVVNQYPPYPEFAGEKFVPLGYKYLLIDQDYVLKPVNKVLCIVEYMPDGSSRNILNQYRRNPRGFGFSRISRIRHAKTFKEKFKNSMHLVSSALFLNDYSLPLRSPSKLITLASVPLGVLLHFYIRYKTQKPK